MYVELLVKIADTARRSFSTAEPLFSFEGPNPSAKLFFENFTERE